MYSAHQKHNDPSTLVLRQEAGRWLKSRREAAGLSQRELATRVGVDYYTFVSQLETGRGRVPPDKYQLWAEALKMDVRDFVLALFPFYDPLTAAILFPDSLPVEATSNPLEA